MKQETAVKLRGWKDAIDVEYSCPRVTQQTVAMTRRFASRVRGNVRVSTGRIWTDDAFENYRKVALSKRMP